MTAIPTRIWEEAAIYHVGASSARPHGSMGRIRIGSGEIATPTAGRAMLAPTIFYPKTANCCPVVLGRTYYIIYSIERGQEAEAWV